jgi:alpha-tubulin suppressor-like RCC1 family protein
VHTCGITTTGSAFCWGANETGELGNGTTTSYAIPVAAMGGLTFTTISATSGAVSTFDYYYYYSYGPPTAHTCGVTTDRVAYCWGDNSNGQLGNPGAGASSSRPVKVTGQ